MSSPDQSPSTSDDVEVHDATWALGEPSLWESPDGRSVPTLLAAIGQVLDAGYRRPSPDAGGEVTAAVIDAAHLERQREWSRATFGPGSRLGGVLDHIRKELIEVEQNPDDATEWADVLILAFDGAWRAGHEPQTVIDAIKAKQARNETRTWPDWRGRSEDEAIEHVAEPEAAAIPREAEAHAAPYEPCVTGAGGHCIRWSHRHDATHTRDDGQPTPVLTEDEREALGERLMLTMTCNHGSDYFGPGAVCETCFANVQRIGRLTERILAARRREWQADQQRWAEIENDLRAALAADDRAALDQVRAEAWDEGYDAATTMARCYGHTDHWDEDDEPRNPYREQAGGEQP